MLFSPRLFEHLKYMQQNAIHCQRMHQKLHIQIRLISLTSFRLAQV